MSTCLKPMAWEVTGPGREDLHAAFLTGHVSNPLSNYMLLHQEIGLAPNFDQRNFSLQWAEVNAETQCCSECQE